MAGLQDYKCPSCGGSIEFNSTTQNMKCPYCGFEMSLEEIESYNQKRDDVKSELNEWHKEEQTWQQGETDGMRIYSCESCGGEIMADENTAASSCPFCGNPIVMTGQVEDDLRPDKIIPFQFDKSSAKQALEKHMEGKKFLPKAFKDQKHIDEIKGVYVPFWIYDADVRAAVEYDATKVKRWEDSNKRYVETSFYDVSRHGKVSFHDIPADASTDMPDDITESIEPFDNSKAVDFDKAYLAGYMANRYDVTAEENQERVDKRIQESTLNLLKETVSEYSTVNVKSKDIVYEKSDVKYMLYPVWLLNTSWNGDNYLFAMNGQTGKFVGNLPCDMGAFWTFTGILSVILALVGFGITYFTDVNIVIGIVAGLLIGLLVGFIIKGQLKSVALETNAAKYVDKQSFRVTGRKDRFIRKSLETYQKEKPKN